MQQVYIPTNKGVKVIMVQNLIRIQASSNYSVLYFNNERPLMVARVLHKFEELLPPNIFQRIHRAHLINRYFISGMSENKKLQLSNGEILPISRRKRDMLSGLKITACATDVAVG
jgi:two-component system, LytTR family, response regulator